MAGSMGDIGTSCAFKYRGGFGSGASLSGYGRQLPQNRLGSDPQPVFNNVLKIVYVRKQF